MTYRWYLKRGDHDTIDLYVEERSPPHRGYVGRFDLPEVSGAELRQVLRRGLSHLREVLSRETVRPTEPTRTFDPVEADERA